MFDKHLYYIRMVQWIQNQKKILGENFIRVSSWSSWLFLYALGRYPKNLQSCIFKPWYVVYLIALEFSYMCSNIYDNCTSPWAFMSYSVVNVHTKHWSFHCHLCNWLFISILSKRISFQSHLDKALRYIL